MIQLTRHHRCSRRSAVGLIAATLSLSLASPPVSSKALETSPAQETSRPQPKPAEVQTQASRVYVFVDKIGLGHQHGVEAKLSSGTLVLGAHQNAGTLVFDMKSFSADTPAARKYVGLSGTTDASTRGAVNTNMRGSAVLDVARYPTATFEVLSAMPTGASSPRGLPTYQLRGNFTLHGVTRPLVFLADVQQRSGWLHVRGSFTIKQSSFGIQPYSKAFGAIGVTDQLKVFGDLYVAPTDKIAMMEIPSSE
ncbi:YceI family protein [Rhodopirellula sp. JC639]|uniref:YceI family protein n=1 Tax=Stieleria mannarensis TaxID=2755585 RepID=UPI0015FEBF03|nr:YceI family protein [Rhodopirellula sp. JC639]